MKTRILILLTLFVLSPLLASGHHPAEDMVDDEIYAFIDEMVADTPHATLDFDEMGNVVITTEFVSTAETLIQQGLLANASLLDGDVTMTIEFVAEEEAGILYSLPDNRASKRHSKWSEWGGEVVITIIQEKDD